MGFFPDLFAGKPEILADPTGKQWYDLITSGKGAAGGARDHRGLLARAPSRRTSCTGPDTRAYKAAWQDTIEAAEKYNEPGRFTAFIGYEWTSNTGGNNLHRNVIFRDNGDKASQVVPYDRLPASGSDNPRDLWKWMAGLRGQDRRQRAGHRAQRQPEQRPHVPDHRAGHRQEDRPGATPRPAPSGSGSTRPRRPRATARRTRSSRPTTSSPTSSAGTRPTWTAAWPRPRRCWSSSTPARP